jgi:beta-galactosidase
MPFATTSSIQSWFRIRRPGLQRKSLLWAWVFILWGSAQAEPLLFTNDFAPMEGYLKPVEQPARQEICLNGSWQFQPVEIPAGWVPNQGVPPELPLPGPAWEATPIRIPSPWNVNTYGCGRQVGAGTSHPYWPDSICFPSYPPAWDGVPMGWLRRTFRVPTAWHDKRVLLHFEAVAGDCQVLLNGRPAGEHFDNFLPFDLDITALVDQGKDNELLVGIRHAHLFDETNSAYAHESATYADGSYLDGIVGIWQDVYLLGLPAVRIADAFVQPWVDRDELLVQATVQNDSSKAEEIRLAGAVSPWVNDAGSDVLGAPEPKWHLAGKVLNLASDKILIPAGTNVVVTLKVPVKNRLKLWSPDTPNLYGLVLTLHGHGKVADTKYQRFGWRQFHLQGSELLLNGRKFQIVADILHPFGVFVDTRRTAWAWFKLIKDVGGNGVRLHAQPWPSYYQDMADEMGLVVLAEDGLFGSSLRLNFTEPVSWRRFAEHYDAMVRRDRDHPSVFGWSFGNELFAIFDYNHLTPADRDKYYAALTQLGRRSFPQDPTREWISCDGDEDLRGTLPVWSKHFGLGLALDRLPTNSAKPLMVGESGGTYYARPAQLSVFNGDRTFESYAGRNEALAIDVYQNIVQMARPRLAYFSASELAWFGLEHLPLGYHDFTRLPTLQDGVFFPPFVEGRPGMQPERIPPYVTTLNPGWDPSLPLYKPLAMFDAMKAALAKDGPKPSPWDHAQATPPAPATATVPATIGAVGFVGDPAGPLFATLAKAGLPWTTNLADAQMIIIDGENLSASAAGEIKPQIDSLLAQGGQVLICFHDAKAEVAPANRLLPAPIALTSRTATALTRGANCPQNAGFPLAGLYFAEDTSDKLILKCGLDGNFTHTGTVVLKASNTDWSQFNDVPENAKCGATLLYENLIKPAGTAWVTARQGHGTISVSAIDYAPQDSTRVQLWRQLLQNQGVKMGPAAATHDGQIKGEHNLLLNGPTQ